MCKEKERILKRTTEKTDSTYHFSCSKCKELLTVRPGETYYSTEETKMIVCLKCKEKEEKEMIQENEIFSQCSVGNDTFKHLDCAHCGSISTLKTGDDYYMGDKGSEICCVCEEKLGNKELKIKVKEEKRIKTTPFEPLGHSMREATSIVKSRESIYGSPAKNFQRIARLWNSYINGTGKSEQIELGPNDVGMMMILVKMARLMETPNHLDSLVDIAGYAECLRQIGEKE